MMFGFPIAPPPGTAIVQWFCIYKVKNDDKYRKKTQAGVCDGSTCGGQAQIHGTTYAPTPDMTDLCPCCSLKSLINGADSSNAFDEAAAPVQNITCMLMLANS
jgi:hypothetical protein